MSKLSRISRRTLLRGAGALLALPWLEAMSPVGAQVASRRPPSRMAFVYVPNGVEKEMWSPNGEGRGLSLSPTLAPLDSVKGEILVHSGLTLDPATAHGDGGGDHARAMASFLTGVHPLKTEGANLRAGVSVDQFAASRIGGSTRFASLEIGCEGGRNAGECDHGYSCAYQSNLSWRGPATPAPKETNPRFLYNRLCGRSQSKDGADSERSIRNRKSVLDFVRNEASALEAKLGKRDRTKLDEYLTSVRELERRIQGSRPIEQSDSGLESEPVGIPYDFAEYVHLMCDLLVFAFRTDQTRVATFVLANDGSNRAYREIGVSTGHHDASHHGGDAEKRKQIAKINRFHVSLFAYLVEKLKSTNELDGSLLDHSLIVYGSGISDGNLHTHEDLPILTAGRFHGKLATGRHLRHPSGTPVSNLYVSMLNFIGAPVSTFGDSTGPLLGLDG